jgi:hypothetical protein
MEVMKKYLRHAFFSMAKNLLLSRRGLVIVSVFLLLGALVPLEFAYAFPNPVSWAFDFGANALVTAALAIPELVFVLVIQLILTISSFLAFLAGFVLDVIVNLDIPFTRCPIDKSGCFIQSAWTMIRDITNMLLIVMLVVIAFATMLRREDYGFKKAFLPLIAAAILVNFSRVIVGVVVDLSTVIMTPFLKEITGIGALMGSLATQGNLLKDQLFDLSFLSLTGNITFVLKTFALIAFQLSYAFILGLYAVIFLTRYVALIMLTIFSPIAFALAIFPSTRKIFRQWMDQLVAWSFIGVTAAFFLWLGAFFMNRITEYSGAFKFMDTKAFTQNNVLEAFVMDMLPYVLLLIFLYASFMMAMRTNAMGAKLIINKAKELGTAARDAGLKFAGRMAQRGAMVGARKTAQVRGRIGGAAARFGGAAVRKVGGAPPLKAVGAWRKGYAERQYKKNAQKWLTRSGLWTGQEKDKNGKLINQYNKPSWGNLTPQQQARVRAQAKSQVAKGAAATLGVGAGIAKGTAGIAKRLSTKAWDTLTPEEQKAIWSAVSFERLRRAKKGETQKAMKDFEEKGLDDPATLKKTIAKETNLNKRLAAEMLLLQKHGDSMSPEERVRVAKKAKAAGFDSQDIAPSLQSDQEIEDVYGSPDKPQYGRAKRAQVAGAAKAVEEELKNIENLTETATRSLLQTATNIHTKMAAIRKLANDHQLERGEFTSIEENLKSFGQITNVLKRSLQFAAPADIEKIMKQMSPQEHRQIDPRIFDLAFDSPEFQAYFKNLTVEAFRQTLNSPVLKQKWAERTKDPNFAGAKNADVHAYQQEEVRRKRVFNTVPGWKP